MLGKISPVLALFFLGTQVLATPTAGPSPLEQGLQHYNNRAANANGLKASATEIEAAITSFKEAMKNPGSEQDAALNLLKAYFFKGTFVVDTDEQRKEVYSLGKQLGEEMTKKYPTSVPFKYWLAVNTGKWSEVYGKLAAAKEGVADKLKGLCEDIIKLDDKFEDGAGRRILGRVHHKSPRIPFLLSWPSNEEAVANLKKAVEYGPNNVTNNLFLAEVLADEGQKQEAMTILEKLVAQAPNPDRVLEDKSDLERAQEVLKDLQQKQAKK